MAAFNLESFTSLLLAETLFYDDEYGAIGSLSLINPEAAREQYIASFMPDEGYLLIEEATEWEEDYASEVDEEVPYALAVDSATYGRYEIPEEAAAALLSLAEAHSLLPSFTLLFETDEL